MTSINLKKNLLKGPHTFTDEEILMILYLKCHAISKNNEDELQAINVFVDENKDRVADMKMLTNVASESYELLLKVLK